MPSGTDAQAGVPLSRAFPKRCFDLVGAVFGLLLFSLPFFLFALLVKLTSTGPIFYRGTRAGRFGRPFRIFKFRSMVTDAENLGGSSTAGGDPRLTRVGRLMRKYKLDELPQLINVLLGQMSFVGPRPEVPRYVETYRGEETEILEVRPGITDWASIWNADEGAVLAGTEDPDKAYEELIRPTKLRLQLKYVREMSLMTDVKIIVYTALKIVRRNWLPKELAEYGRLQDGPGAEESN